MHRKLVVLAAALLTSLSVWALPGVARAATIQHNTNMWFRTTWSPSSVHYGFDSVSVDLHTDDAINSNYETIGIRFTAVVSADQSATRVSIERVALASVSRVLFIWEGLRLGPNGIAQVGPSSPYKPPSGCYYRMRINYSVRWANGQLVHYSWLTGWSRDFWVRGC